LQIHTYRFRSSSSASSWHCFVLTQSWLQPYPPTLSLHVPLTHTHYLTRLELGGQRLGFHICSVLLSAAVRRGRGRERGLPKSTPWVSITLSLVVVVCGWVYVCVCVCVCMCVCVHVCVFVFKKQSIIKFTFGHEHPPRHYLTIVLEPLQHYQWRDP